MPNDIDAALDELRRRHTVPTDKPTGVFSTGALDVDQDIARIRREKGNLSQQEQNPEPLTPTVPVKPVTRQELELDTLDLSLRHASTSDPAAEAERRNLANKLGVDKLMLPDPETARQELFLKENNPVELLRNNPEIAKYLQDPENAIIAGKDVGALKEVMGAMRRIHRDSLVATAKTTVAVPQSLAGVYKIYDRAVKSLIPDALTKAVDNATPQQIREALGTVERDLGGLVDFKQTQDFLEEFYSPETLTAKAEFGQAQGFFDSIGAALGSPSSIGATVGESIGPMLLAGGIAQTIIKAFPALAPLIAGAIGEGVTIAGSTAQGMTEDTGEALTGKQALLSVGAGALGVGVNVLGGKIMQQMGVIDPNTAMAQGTLKKALKDSKMPDHLAVRVAAGAVGEGVFQEMPQSAIEQIAHNVGTGKPWDDGVENAMAMGMLAGSVVGGTIQAFVPKAPNEGLNKDIDDAAVDALRNVGRAQEAEDNKQTLEEFSKAVSSSELRKNSPEEFKKFVRTMADEGEMIEEVYVDPKTLNEAFAQSEITPEEIAEKMPELAKEMQVAEQAGTDVRISFDDYATFIAGSKAETGIIDHLRTTPEGMTFSEAQLFQKEQTKVLTEQAKKILDENQPVLTKAEFLDQNPQGDYKEYQAQHQNRREVFAVDAQQVHDDILTGLNKAGRFNRDVNAVYAVPFREFFATAAAKEGILPSELYKRMPLNFQNVKIEDGLLDQPAGSFTSADLTNLSQKEIEDLLVVQHNLTAANLLHVNKMGGLAAPSVAIAKSKNPLMGFGEITLVGDKNLVRPSSDTQAFGADIYSPRYPKVSYDFTKQNIATLEKAVAEGLALTEGGVSDPQLLDDDPVRALRDNPAVLAQYLLNIGKKPKIVRVKKTKFEHPELKKFLNSKMDAFDMGRDPEFKRIVAETYAKKREHLPEGVRKATEMDDEGKASLARKRANEIEYYKRNLRNVGKIDKIATRNGLRKQIKNQAEFSDFVLGLIEQASPKERLFKGFTYSGTRRYQEHTLDNVIKELKKNLRSGEGFNYGLGSIRSTVTPKFRSIEDIQKNRNRIMDSESFEVVKEEMLAEYNALSDKLEAYHDAHHFDTAAIALTDSAKMGIPKALRENGFENVPVELRQELAGFMDKLKSMPTEYFEVKLLRAVSLGEFSGAVVPSNVSPKVIEALKANGITDIRKYKADDKDARVNAIAKFNDLFFQTQLRTPDAQQENNFGDVNGRARTIAGLPPQQGFEQQTKIRGRDGTPLTVFRGSKAGLKDSHFEKAALGFTSGAAPSGRGVHFTTTRSAAQVHGDVREFQLDIRKPYVFKADDESIPSHDTAEEYFEWREGLRAQGFDGIVEIASHLGGPNTIIAFDPQQVIEKPQELNQSAFFSALSKEIGGLKKIANKQGMVKPEQAIQWITARQKEGKFKQAEVDAVGILDWLSATKEPVSVSDVEQFVQANGIQIEETLLADVFDDEFLELEDTVFFQRIGDGKWQVFGEHASESDVFDTQSEAEDRMNEILGELRGSAVDGDVSFGSYVLPGGENYRELLLRLPNRGQSFKSSHFDQENIVAHVRLNERQDVDGNKVLFIEEIQSDWAQEGRKKGFQHPKQKQRLEALEQVIEKRYPDAGKRPRDKWTVRFLLETGVPESIAEKRHGLMMSSFNNVPPGPFLENTKDWTALAFKRMLRYAAENGFEKIAWTTGEQQADRYSLRGEAHHVTIGDVKKDGTRWVAFSTKEYNTLGAGEEMSRAQMEKALPASVLEEIDKKEPFNGTLDLPEVKTIGGEGMIAYYDSIVPQVVTDVMKKLKGPKVGKTEIEGIDAQPSIDITPELRAKIMEGLPLFQDQKIQNRAAYDPTNFTISLLKGADLSSVIHEGGHFYLEALADMASQPNAIQQVKDDMRKTLNWFGINGPEPEGVWRLMTLDQKRQYHEQWAQSFERYALEGKSPTLEMQPVFARFRRWMLSVYKSLKEFLKQNPLAGKLNDDIRQVFDRILAADEAIKEAEKAREYAPLFANANDAGVTDKEFQAYMEQGKTATERSLDELASRSLKDMQWLSNAKDKTIKKLQKQADEKRKVIRQEVMEEVLATPVHRAMTFLRSGKITRDDGTVETLKEHKLNSDDVRDIRPGMDLRSLPGMTKPDGLDPDFAAQLFGFESGDALITAILTEPKAAETISALTDKRMLEEHGDLVDPESISRAADKAIHNEARARFTATGLMMLAKKEGAGRGKGVVNQIIKAAKQAAESVIEAKKIRDLNPNQFTMAEKRANKEAIKHAGKKDNKRAIEAQRAALINNKLFVAARDAKDEVEKALDYLKKFDSANVRKKLDIDYLEQIDDLKKAFDLRKGISAKALDKRQSLADWIDEQKANNFEPAIDAEVMEELKRKHYKDMTMGEIRSLVDSIKQIEHLGRMKKQLLTAKDKKEFQVRVDEADTSIRENANRTVPERGTPTDIIGMTGKWARGMAAMHRKFNSFMREMDGGKDNGIMWNLFSRGMNEAGDIETEMKQVAADKVAELFKGLPKNETAPGNIYARKKIVPGTRLSMTHEQRVMFGMNWGNEGNRQRILDGGMTGQRALSQKEADAVLDTLTKDEWDAIQGVWDYLETYKPQIAALEKKLTGVEPEWIEPAPVKTKFGTYRGGYLPAKYDSELSTRSASLEAATDTRMDMKGAFGRAATRDSFNKKRSDKVINRPLLLNYNVISTHVSDVIHRLAWQPWLTDSNRLLTALDAPIREHYGVEVLEELRQTMIDIAQGDAPGRTPIDKGLNWLRTGSTIVGMGWRFTTAAMQITGLTQSWSRIGSRWMAEGVARYAASPLKSSEFVNQKSRMMKDRSITMNREINDVMNTIRAGEKVSVITGSFFTMITKMQRVVDVPTWRGAYEKGLHQLKYENALDEKQRKDIEEHAAALADQAVLDSQSGGQLKDLARVQRGRPVWKLFTNFYSYFSAVYNLNIEAVRRTSFKSPSQIGLLMADMVLLNMLPVLFTVALKNILRPECEWDDLECLAKGYAKDQVSHFMGQHILLREAAPSVEGLLTGKSYGYQGPAGLRFYNEVNKLGVQVGQGEADMPLFKTAMATGGVLLHLPTGQVTNTIEGIMAVERGDVEGISILPALLAGPPKD